VLDLQLSCWMSVSRVSDGVAPGLEIQRLRTENAVREERLTKLMAT